VGWHDLGAEPDAGGPPVDDLPERAPRRQGTEPVFRFVRVEYLWRLRPRQLEGIDYDARFPSRPSSEARDRRAKPQRRHGGRLGRYFGNAAQFWLDLQGQHEIAVVEREKGEEIARRVKPAGAA